MWGIKYLTGRRFSEGKKISDYRKVKREINYLRSFKLTEGKKYLRGWRFTEGEKISKGLEIN